MTENKQIAKIISENFMDGYYSDEDFEQAAEKLQEAGFHRRGEEVDGEIFDIISNTINGANFDDINDAACRIERAGYSKQSENVVELPCKIGDTVYITDSWRASNEPLPYQITNLTITQNKKGVWTKKYRAMWFKNGKTVDSQYNFEFEDIGKTVFLTKEEAEQDVAKMKGGAE